MVKFEIKTEQKKQHLDAVSKKVREVCVKCATCGPATPCGVASQWSNDFSHSYLPPGIFPFPLPSNGVEAGSAFRRRPPQTLPGCREGDGFPSSWKPRIARCKVDRNRVRQYIIYLSPNFLGVP